MTFSLSFAFFYQGIEVGTVNIDPPSFNVPGAALDHATFPAPARAGKHDTGYQAIGHVVAHGPVGHADIPGSIMKVHQAGLRRTGFHIPCVARSGFRFNYFRHDFARTLPDLGAP